MRQVATLIIIICRAFCVNAQDVAYMQLKDEKAAFSPKTYHITQVADDRENVAFIGQMNGNGKKESIAIRDGVAAALDNFIRKNVSQDKTTQPIALHISKMDVDVKRQGSLWNVEAAISLTFYVGDKKVVEYSGKGHGEMDTDPDVYIESYIRQVIENDLKKFDEWWPQNKGRIATTEAVKVNVSIGKTIEKPNCIVYSTRPLEIADFTGRPEGEGMELAITTSGIAVSYAAQTENSQVVVDVVVTPYFNKPLSWFKPQGKNPRVLAHEQAHFDITAIKACELADQIRHTVFTQDNYKALLGELQEKNSNESNNEESLYDNETNHGIIRDKQEAWENKVKEQVKKMGCY